MNPQRIILRLLIGLARLALEHDRGFASRAVWTQINSAIKEGESYLEVQQ